MSTLVVQQVDRGSLGTYRKLAQANPQAYLPDVATTLNNLGNLYSDTQRLSESEQAFQEALGIGRITHVLSWYQVQDEQALGDALKQVKEAGLIPEDQVRLCVVAHGARWIWKHIKTLFPLAVQILDYYHSTFAGPENQRNQWVCVGERANFSPTSAWMSPS